MSEEILDKCMNCNCDLTEKNSMCCYDTECQHSRERGIYCVDCYPLHREAFHGDKI